MNNIDFNDPHSIDKSDVRHIDLHCGIHVRISAFHTEFYDQLLKLSNDAKIELLQLDYADMDRYVAKRKKQDLDKLIDLLGRQWYSREEGDPMARDIAFDELDGNSMNDLLKKCKSKKTPTIDIIHKAIDFLTGDRSEFYCDETR
jgi:hypothetical protein